MVDCAWVSFMKLLRLLYLFVLLSPIRMEAAESDYSIVFPPLSATIEAPLAKQLEPLLEKLRANPELSLQIEAPMEANAASAYWRHLGRLRGFALYFEFTQKGINPERLKILSGGHIHRESHAGGPRRDNRVRFVFTKERYPLDRPKSTADRKDYGPLPFPYDSGEIPTEVESTLDDVAATLEKHPDVRIAILGHSDLRGQQGFKRIVSRLRALSVYEALSRRGVAAQRMSLEIMGDSRPVVAKIDAATDIKNRRVELVFTPPLDQLKEPEKKDEEAIVTIPETSENAASSPSEGEPYILGLGFGLAKAGGELGQRLDQGLGVHALIGRRLIRWNKTDIYVDLEAAYATFEKTMSNQDNDLQDTNISFGILADHPLSESWSVLGRTGLGMSVWEASASEKSSGRHQDNSGNDLSWDLDAALAWRFESSWRLMGRWSFRTVAGDFDGNYQTLSIGLLKEIAP